MNINVIRTLVVCIAILTLASCRKKGCTDRFRDNYDPEAIIDDGSCTKDLLPSATIIVSDTQFSEADSIPVTFIATDDHWLESYSFEIYKGNDVMLMGDGMLSGTIDTQTVMIGVDPNAEFFDQTTNREYYGDYAVKLKIWDVYGKMTEQEGGFELIDHTAPEIQSISIGRTMDYDQIHVAFSAFDLSKITKLQLEYWIVDNGQRIEVLHKSDIEFSLQHQQRTLHYYHPKVILEDGQLQSGDQFQAFVKVADGAGISANDSSEIITVP